MKEKASEAHLCLYSRLKGHLRAFYGYFKRPKLIDSFFGKDTLMFKLETR